MPYSSVYDPMAMLSVPLRPSATAAQSIPPNMTLRLLIEARRSEGRRLSLEEAISIIVPACLDLRDRHVRGERLYVHPSAIAPSADGLARVQTRLAVVPTHHDDKHCLAPELQRTLEPGDACASVFSLGAMLYEMVTGQHIGPAMRRPRDFDPSLPEAFEVLIGKAIVGDRAHRPADLGALASAMYHLAPQKSIHPPEVSEALLDESAELDLDVRFSMLPPAPAAAAPRATPEGSGANAAVARTIDDPTARLGALKARLESDPRPRYVVSKDRMDHGPFNAVELLQQITSHAFTAEHGLRDEISGEQMPIAEWEEFAPFAEQSLLVREKRAEQKAVVRAASDDKKRGIAKSIVAVSVVIALTGALAVWFFTRRGTRDDNVIVAKDRTGTVEVHGDIRGKKKAAAGGGGGGGGGGGYAGGVSYESVLNSNNQEIGMGQASGAPDLTDAQLSAPLRHASFVVSCGAPDDMKVTVRVAVRMGRAVGVTATTNPPNGGVAGCVDRSVRGLRWAESAKTDFITTNY
jgi:eukaryotic-like serine/threonine-protein kinase